MATATRYTGVRREDNGEYYWRGLSNRKPAYNRGPFATAAAARDNRAEVLAGHDGTPRGDSAMTVAEVFARWIDSRQLITRPSTRAWYGNYLRNHVQGTPFGARPIGAVTALEETAWLTSRSREHGGTLGQGQLFILAGLMRCAGALAVEAGWLTSNPFPTARKLGLKAPRPDHPDMPSTDEVQQVANTGHERIRAMILVQSMTGMRIGEMRGLRWQDIKDGPAGKFIRLRYQRAQLTKNALVPLKNSARMAERTIPLTPRCVSVLNAHKLRFGQGEDGTVFVNLAGRPWGHSHLANLYKEAFDAGQREDRTGTDCLSSHSLRHHYVSVLLRHGVPVPEISARIGDDPEQIWHTYGHLMPSDDATTPALGRAWEGVDEGEAARTLPASGRVVQRPDTPAVRAANARGREYMRRIRAERKAAREDGTGEADTA